MNQITQGPDEPTVCLPRELKAEFNRFWNSHSGQVRAFLKTGVKVQEISAYATFLKNSGLHNSDVMSHLRALILDSSHHPYSSQMIKKILKDPQELRKWNRYLISQPRMVIKSLFTREATKYTTPINRLGNLRASKALRTANGVGKGLKFLAFSEEVMKAREQNDWGRVVGFMAKEGMNRALPGASFAGFLQSTFASFAPAAASNEIGKIVRLINPSAWASTGADSITTVLQCVLESGSCVPRLQRLVDRMNESGLGAWTDLGDRLGDWLYDITHN